MNSSIASTGNIPKGEVPIPGNSLIFFFFITLGFTIVTLISIQNAKSIESIDKSVDDFDLSALWRNSRSYFNEPFGTRPGEKKDDGQIVDNCLYLLDPYTGEWCR